MLGIDCGNYTPVPTPAQVAQLRAVGVRFAIIGTSYGTVAEAQLAAFKAGGLVVAEYQFPEAWNPTQRPWWTDCELPTATPERIRAALADNSSGPYSRSGWWGDHYPSWDLQAEFPRSKLWDARYIGTMFHNSPMEPCLIVEAQRGGGDVAAAIRAEEALTPRFRPYAGYTRATITQWHNSVELFGLNVDINTAEELEEDDDMKPIRIWCAERQKTYLLGPAGAVEVLYPADDKELERLYGPHAAVLTGAQLDALAPK